MPKKQSIPKDSSARPQVPVENQLMRLFFRKKNRVCQEAGKKVLLDLRGQHVDGNRNNRKYECPSCNRLVRVTQAGLVRRHLVDPKI